MGYVILGVVGLLLAVILLRAAFFNPKPQKAVSQEEVHFDREKAIDALQQLVRCKTISNHDPALEDEGAFRKLIDLLPGLSPKVFETCSFRELPDRGLLFCWPGKRHDAPPAPHFLCPDPLLFLQSHDEDRGTVRVRLA
jgi:hypothetical protein